ncbi:MAG: hypothetical protein R2828_33270 [Saprospiraceae bacterium]
MNQFIRKIILFATGLWLLNLGLDYFLGVLERDVDKKGYAFDKYRWEEFYQLPKGDTLDILFLGSSHTYRGINPFLIDSLLNIHTYNLGSSGQTPITSYFVLKHASAYVHPKMVVMDLYFHTLMEKNQLANGGNNWLELNASLSKWQFLLQGFDLYEISALTVLPVLRKKGNVRYVLRKYLSGDDHLDEAGTYIGKGYVERTSSISLSALEAPGFYDRLNLEGTWALPKQEKGLQRLVDFCKQKGIKLVFISAPLPKTTYSKIKDRVKIKRHLDSLTNHLGIVYHDDTQNMQLRLQDTVHFFDDNHLNKAGVKVWNSSLQEILGMMIK